MAFTQRELELLKWGQANGKSRTEIEGALTKMRSGFTPPAPTPSIEEASSKLGIGQFQDTPFEGGRPEPTFKEEIVEKANIRADRFGDIADRETAPASKERAIQGVQLFGQGVGLAADAFEGAISRIPLVKEAFEGLGKGIQAGAEGKYSPLRVLGEHIGGNSEALQEAVNLYDNDQEFKDSVDAVANIVRLGGDVTLASQVAGLPTKVIGKIKSLKTQASITADVAKRSAPPTQPKLGASVAEDVTSKVDDIITKGVDLRTNIRTTLAGKNVDPQLEVSARRFAQGTDRLNDPLATYEKFLTQSKSALTDTKVDPAISVVGENIGNNFGKVVKMRQGVGKVMEAEIQKIGKVKTNIAGVADEFAAQLGTGSRFAKGEQAILQAHEKALLALGDNPTIRQIDDFLVRTNSELQLFKGKQGLTTTTNAERIIKGSLAKLREQFDPVKTNNPKLKAYADARGQYSELTNFIQEGERHLGKLTQSGDYARDASMAKSSVQSVLNNGKKDWLLELEGLTGYQATDEAVLALQAMKDAGDFRGLSLLETFADSPAITPTGIIDKAGAFIVEKGKRAIVGTPEEQTRIFLQSLKGKGAIPETVKIKQLISHEGAPDKARVKFWEKKIKDGETIEPLIVVKEGNKLGIEDGKHRFQAYKNLGIEDIPIQPKK